MRKTFAILAFCCLIFLTVGYQVAYLLRIAEAKKEMKSFLRNVKEDELIQFSFTAQEINQLAWEDAHEFHYAGEMYDVVKKELVNGKMNIWCVSDTKEKALVDDYLKTQKNSSQSSSSGSMVKLLSVQFLPSSFITIHLPECAHRETLGGYLFYLPKTEASIITPPPQIC